MRLGGLRNLWEVVDGEVYAYKATELDLAFKLARFGLFQTAFDITLH